MLKFFFFTEDIKVKHTEFNFTYEHLFEKADDLNNVGFGKVYFSTESNLNTHCHNLAMQFGDKYNNSIRVISNDKVMAHEQFPVDIGFKENLETALESFKGRKLPLKVAIINAMSNAIGDHLIGMRAFDCWLERVEEYLGVPVEVTFFQLNPMRMGPITAQRKQLRNIFILPNKMTRFAYHDAYIDLSSLILRETFNEQPMIDFFFDAMSIPSESVPNEKKRIKFSYDPQSVLQIEHIINVLRTKKRPILLFHHKSTSAVREMTDERARKTLKQLLDKTDYFIVSAMNLEYQHERYLDISRFSQPSLFHFAAIIDMVDAVITVDTSTYHFADAFDTPTVALFTTIEPDFRVRYYPLVESVMLEKNNGENYGLHKSHLEPEALQKQVEYTDNLWDTLDLDDVLVRLNRVIQKKKEGNYERCNSSRGLGHEAITLDEGDKQVFAPRLQQTDDLLPDPDTCGSGNQ